MPFRIAIGRCRCADGLTSRNSRVRELCSRILSRLERLRSLKHNALTSLAASETEQERIAGRPALLTTYREKLASGETLVVVQGFLRSWWFPTYIGAVGVGYVYAEGILIDTDGRIRDPEDNLLWPFR